MVIVAKTRAEKLVEPAIKKTSALKTDRSSKNPIEASSLEARSYSRGTPIFGRSSGRPGGVGIRLDFAGELLGKGGAGPEYYEPGILAGSGQDHVSCVLGHA